MKINFKSLTNWPKGSTNIISWIGLFFTGYVLLFGLSLFLAPLIGLPLALVLDSETIFNVTGKLFNLLIAPIDYLVYSVLGIVDDDGDTSLAAILMIFPLIAVGFALLGAGIDQLRRKPTERSKHIIKISLLGFLPYAPLLIMDAISSLPSDKDTLIILAGLLIPLFVAIAVGASVVRTLIRNRA